MYEIPLKFGWVRFTDANEEYVDFIENTQNLTEKQCLIVADVVSKETKQVDIVMSDEEFEKEFFNQSTIKQL